MASRENKPEEKISSDKSIVLYLHDLVYLLSGMMVVLLLLFRVVIVDGTSMNHTLLDGDYLLLLSNSLYRNVEQGDIVVISKASFEDGTPIVKRVIATEGQTVDIDFSTGTVYVDGVALEEDYINSPTYTNGGTEFPLVVEEGCVFVMGDNRGVSLDSRYPEVGLVDEREILGKAVLLFLPGTNAGEESMDIRRNGVISRRKRTQSKFSGIPAT